MRPARAGVSKAALRDRSETATTVTAQGSPIGTEICDAAATSSLRLRLTTRSVRTSPAVSGGRQESARSIGPLSSEEDLRCPRWQVLFHLGVVVGQNAGDIGIGLGPLVLGVTGRDEV